MIYHTEVTTALNHVFRLFCMQNVLALSVGVYNGLLLLIATFSFHFETMFIFISVFNQLDAQNLFHNTFKA